eukprot:349634-Chlamydomonas_euryale.AAC.11
MDDLVAINAALPDGIAASPSGGALPAGPSAATMDPAWARQLASSLEVARGTHSAKRILSKHGNNTAKPLEKLQTGGQPETAAAREEAIKAISKSLCPTMGLVRGRGQAARHCDVHT